MKNNRPANRSGKDKAEEKKNKDQSILKIREEKEIKQEKSDMRSEGGRED